MVLLMLMSVTCAWAGNAKDAQTGGENKVKVIIGYVDKPNQADEDMIRGHGGKTKYTYHIIDAKAVEIPERAIAHIKNNPRVAYVEMDAEVHALGETLPWGVDRIDAEIVHANNKGTGVKVAIIDSGIDKDHPDLQANIEGGINFVSSHR
jgi:subtilisin